MHLTTVKGRRTGQSLLSGMQKAVKETGEKKKKEEKEKKQQ